LKKERRARRDDWVVTYRVETATSVITTEFYRGDMEECIRIGRHSMAGEDDRYRTPRRWVVVVGPARDWDDFLEREGN
jgi:hypothetical protein